MKNFFFLITFLIGAANLQAQQHVTLEKIRCLSNVGPVMFYWNSPEVKRSFITDLQHTLQQRKNLSLTNSQLPEVEMVGGNAPGREQPAFTDKDTNTLYLYIDIYELAEDVFFSYAKLANSLESLDSTLFSRAKTYFVARVFMYNASKQSVFNDELMMIISNSETSGIGIAYQGFNGYSILATTPKGFSGILAKSMDLVFDSTNKMDLVEMKAPAVYMADNFLIPLTGKLDKIFVQTKREVSKFNYQGKTEIIRMGDAMYEEIILKGKRKQIQAIPPDIKAAIDILPDNKTSDYVFLRQESRDVGLNRNYLLKMPIEINPYIGGGSANTFTGFLEGGVHRLMLDKDTVATFMISKNVASDPNRLVYLNKVSNGADTSSFFPINARETIWRMRYAYMLNGKIGKHSFAISIGGSRNRLKEFYLDGKTVCIAEGLFNPEKFVMIDPSIDAELLNQLFIIGFSRFFV